MKVKVIIPFVVVFVIAVFFFFGKENEEFKLVAENFILRAAEETIISDSEVGTGFSVAEEPRQAVTEATIMALKGKTQRNPDFAIIFASSGSDLTRILHSVREILGKDIKIFGGTSDSRAVMTDKGFVRVTRRGYIEAGIEGPKGLAIMTVSSKDITFGVGSADLSKFSSTQEMSQNALLKAIENAGKTPNELPQIVLLCSTIGIEEEVLEGFEKVLNQTMPVLGGTAGGPNLGVFGENESYKEGISVAVVYTDLPIGWIFEGGFDVTDNHAGTVTAIDGQNIIEIDNKPALEVYNEWLHGEIERLNEEVGEVGKIRDLLTLHPLYRKYTSHSGQDYFLFSHPWPKDIQLNDKTICTSTKIKIGEKIHLSHGTWETLINRIGNLPRKARIHGEMGMAREAVFSLGFICGGVMGVIPEEERDKLPFLVNYANNNAPFIAAFTWGEQGFFPGVGNKHGNLLTSFLVIGSKM